MNLTCAHIRSQIADSDIIFQRGQHIYRHGAFLLKASDPEAQRFIYEIDGNYGDYTVSLTLADPLATACDCPYPGPGCKHVVAALLDAAAIMDQWKEAEPAEAAETQQDEWLSPAEIRELAVADRHLRARKETFTVIPGEMIKGEHLVETELGRQYTVTLHDPASGSGHCSCPDYLTNRLGTCKHMIHLGDYFKKQKNTAGRLKKERFPFVDLYWDSVSDQPRLFRESSDAGEQSADGLADWAHFKKVGLLNGHES